MGGKRSACLDCGRPSYGERCLECDKARRKTEAAEAIRSCACEADAETCRHTAGACRNRLSSRNRTGVCLDCLRRSGALKVDAKLPEPQPRLPPRADLEVTQTDDVLRISSCRPGIETVADAIRHAGIDTAVWEITKKRVRSYQSPNRDGSRQMVAISLELKRRVPESVIAALEAFVKSRGIPRAKSRSSKTTRQIDTIAVYSPSDAHFGSLCWAPETGDDYDLKIAEKRYLSASQEAASSVSGFSVGSWVYPLGSDFLHFDTLAQTTTSGTPLDADGRALKVYARALRAAIGSVYELLERGPVRIIWVGGNHDRVSSYFVCLAIREHFRDDQRVTVDLTPGRRSYHEFGETLFGFTHGDGIKHDKLPLVMASERPKEWAATRFREWFIGHYHHRQRTSWIDTKETMGCIVRQLPSLAGTDAWHHEQGFVGNHKAAEVHVYRRKGGHIAQLTVGSEHVAA